MEGFMALVDLIGAVGVSVFLGLVVVTIVIVTKPRKQHRSAQRPRVPHGHPNLRGPVPLRRLPPEVLPLPPQGVPPAHVAGKYQGEHGRRGR